MTIVIAALEITAPVGSVTVPTIVPVGVCAITVTFARNRIDNRRFMTRKLRRGRAAGCAIGKPVELRFVWLEVELPSYTYFWSRLVSVAKLEDCRKAPLLGRGWDVARSATGVVGVVAIQLLI